MVLVTSFEESFLGSLKAEDLTRSVKNGDAAMKLEHGSGFTENDVGNDKKISFGAETVTVTSASTLMSQSQSPPQTKSPSISYTVKKDSDSPTLVDDSGSDGQTLSPTKPKGQGGDQWGSFTKNASGRVLYVSEKDYKAHELVKLVYTALKISKEAYRAFQKQTCNLHDGVSYLFSRALQVCNNTDRWEWGKLEATIGKSIEEQGRKSNPRSIADGTTRTSHKGTFYIVGNLGQGNSSNVFQALDDSGNLVAMKVFVNDELEKEAEKSCTQEKDNMLKCYEFLKGKVDVVKMCSLYAVVMPIFVPIPKNDREKRLNEVEAGIKNMREKAGKKYQQCDVRWRHVGTFQEHVVLFDLADLVEYDDVTSDDETNEVDNNEEKEGDPVLKAYMEIFKQRCGNDDSCPTQTNAVSFFGDVVQKNAE